MSTRRLLLWLGALAIGAGGGALSYRLARGTLKPAPVVQPLPFNHSRHVAGGPRLACVTCHPGAEEGTHAGLPSLEKCMSCHMKPQSTSLAERAVRELALQPGPHPFKPVTRNAGHVRFSHRAHVSLGGMPCAHCHGDVTKWTAPPTEPVRELLDMDRCLDCHRAKGARTSCVVCHQ